VLLVGRGDSAEGQFHAERLRFRGPEHAAAALVPISGVLHLALDNYGASLHFDCDLHRIGLPIFGKRALGLLGGCVLVLEYKEAQIGHFSSHIASERLFSL